MISLRPARSSDAALLRRWRNDPRVHRHYLTPRPVTQSSHAAWLAARLSDARCRLFVLLENGRPCGQVRLDIARDGAEVSLCVDPARQGRGLGARALELAAARARRLGLRRLWAVTRPANVASTVAFLKAGFLFDRRARAGGREVYRLSRRTS